MGSPEASIFDRCECATIQLVLNSGRRVRRSAWRHGDLAVHLIDVGGDKWTIAHLPSGYTMRGAAAVFGDAEAAIRAMLEIHPLRNDWAALAPDDLPSLRRQIQPICERHGGARPDWEEGYAASLDRVNGYDGARA